MACLLFFGFFAGAGSTDVCITSHNLARVRELPQDEASLIQMQKGTLVHTAEHTTEHTDRLLNHKDQSGDGNIDASLHHDEDVINSAHSTKSFKAADKRTSFVQTDASASSAVLPGWTDQAFGDSSGTEYVAHMRGVIRQFSHVARKRMAEAQEELEAQQIGETGKEATAKASSVVADTGSAAADLAGQFCEQMRSAKDDVVNLLGEMDSADSDEKPALSTKLMPVVSFLSELTAGSADLMGGSVDEFGVVKPTLASVKVTLNPGAELAPSDKSAIESALLQQDPDQIAKLAHQALDQADVALNSATSFEAQLSSAVHGEQALMEKLADADGDDIGPLQQAVIEASRGVSLLLSGDFVAMESKRLVGEEQRAAAGPKTASCALLVVGLAVWAAHDSM